jgi:pyridinium-3,5-biscarboxylic acid mononucleotide synthase
MNAEQIRAVLEQVQAGTLSVEEALAAVRWLPYEEMGFARVDTHRRLRTGYPEIVFCQGKTPEQAAAIVARLAETNEFVLATRAAPEHAEAIRRQFPEALYHEPARIVEVRSDRPPTADQGSREEEAHLALLRAGRPPLEEEIGRPLDGEASVLGAGGRRSAVGGPFILVISAGTADIPVAEEAVVTAQALGSRVERLYDVGVAGLHRLLDRKALLDDANVIIVVAGMEGALPSVVGGLVEQPVIAVPTSIGYGASFQGLAALLTMLNSCATGIAVVNIDNGFGAGYFAHLINSRTAFGGARSAELGARGGEDPAFSSPEPRAPSRSEAT